MRSAGFQPLIDVFGQEIEPFHSSGEQISTLLRGYALSTQGDGLKEASRIASEVLAQVHAVVQGGHLVPVAIEHQRGAALFIEGQPMRRSVFWLQRGWSTLGLTLE